MTKLSTAVMRDTDEYGDTETYCLNCGWRQTPAIVLDKPIHSLLLLPVGEVYEPRACAECGTIYQPRTSNQKYCEDACNQRHHTRTRKRLRRVV